MKYTLLILSFVFCTSFHVQAQEVKLIKFNTLEEILQSKEDKTYVINFWATWCAPCVKELPYFEKLHRDNPDVEVILINLDFASALENKVIPFVKRKDIQAKVLLLDEPDYDSWIDKVEKNWSGAIPFTLIFNNHRSYRKYFEGELTEDELLNMIQ